MDRVPEPELMLDESQARAYADADFEEPHARFIAQLLARLPDLPDDGVALDLGCGPGDITLRFARARPAWEIDGLDASPAMLSLARAAAGTAVLAERVSFTAAHIPAASLPRARYDLVLSNSLLHHLAVPAPLWSWLATWARGTPLFLMDLLRPASRDAARQLVERYAAGEPEVLRVDFFNSLLAAYRAEEVRAQLRAAQLAHLTVEIVSDRHLIVYGRL